MRKFLIITVTIVSILLLVGMTVSCAFFVKWYSIANEKSIPELLKTDFESRDIKIGQRIPCVFQIKTLWNLMPVGAEYTPPEGTQTVQSPSIQPDAWQWGSRIWNVTVWIQPFRDGEKKETPVQILLEGGPDGKEVLNASIPAFRVTALTVTPGSTLAIADEVQIPEKYPARWIWLIIAGLILIAVILWLIFRRKNDSGEPEVPVWKTALDAISRLKQELISKKLTPESAVIRLTDIVRNYLERQFSLRAEHQTTGEFLDSLRSGKGPLDVEQRHFLREFLSAADMVKFARLPAEESLFSNAAERAESLIRNTVQDDTNNKEKDV